MFLKKFNFLQVDATQLIRDEGFAGAPEADQQLLQTMRLKPISGTLRLKMTNDSVVIHEEPVIAESPISPNVTLNLICGTALGLLVSPLLALLAMVLASRIIPVKEA